MENVIWFFLIGGLIFWMMRKGGCCGGHGGHRGHGDGKVEQPDADSVDGVEHKEPAKTAEHGGCH